MVSIEHCLWTGLSEGDIRVGTGKRCQDGGNPQFALDWVRTNGLIDAEGYPDTTADMPHLTVADRSGRTVRLDQKYVDIGPLPDQKRWINAVGPLASSFTVWTDFFALGAGVYRRIDTVSVNGQPNFGTVNDGRPFWIGDFSGSGHDEVLFYFPGDDNWWLGSYNAGQLQWSLVGNTAGFGNGINDGRPFWIGDFSGSGHDEVLFYFPGDGNWWLGNNGRGQLQWSLVGNTGTPNKVEGRHCLLVIGYHDPDDADPDGYWIVKNSWGTNWGEKGFGKVAYGETDIDTWAKTGLRNTNPDPWSKRRLHAGNLLESGNGANHRNFELFSTGAGGHLRSWWRDNDSANLPWNLVGDFGSDDVAAFPTVTAGTFNRNFELVYTTRDRRMHHWYLDQATATWKDAGLFGPVGASGVAGFAQTNRHAAGDFEVVVRTSDARLRHLVRHNGHVWTRPAGTWFEAASFGESIALSGPSLVQVRTASGNRSSDPTFGDLHVVAVSNSQVMEHWTLVSGSRWARLSSFGASVTTAPCMIQSQFGMVDELGIGNFELCVAVDGAVQHWWRDNNDEKVWRQGATFGTRVASVVGLLQGSFGFNLELVVLTTDNQMQHYWRDAGGWYDGGLIGNVF